MFYVEEIIDGILCGKTTPDGKWHPLSPEMMTKKIAKQKEELAAKDVEIAKLTEILTNMANGISLVD